MKLSNIQKDIIKDLSKAHNGLNLYTFWARYKLSPNMLLTYIRKLVHEDLVILTSSRIALTEKGISWVYQNRHIIYSTSNKAWLEIPEEFKAPIIKVNRPFVPFRDRLHKSMFLQN